MSTASQKPAIALYQPDIPGNTGTILRMAACLGLEVHVIEPAGFDLTDRSLRRSGMDYAGRAVLKRHVDWQGFDAWSRTGGRRLVLATTHGATSYTRLVYRHDDILLFGRESAGVPEEVHGRADVRIVIPMREGMRSLNVAVSAAMIVGEAIRQTG